MSTGAHAGFCTKATGERRERLWGLGFSVCCVGLPPIMAKQKDLKHVGEDSAFVSTRSLSLFFFSLILFISLYRIAELQFHT